MTLKHLVLALAVAAACAVAPSSPRGSTEAVGDTFEMSLAKATLAVTPKLRGASEGHRPAGRGLDFGQDRREHDETCLKSMNGNRSNAHLPSPPHRPVPWRREEPGRDPPLLKNIDQRP